MADPPTTMSASIKLVSSVTWLWTIGKVLLYILLVILLLSALLIIIGGYQSARRKARDRLNIQSYQSANRVYDNNGQQMNNGINGVRNGYMMSRPNSGMSLSTSQPLRQRSSPHIPPLSSKPAPHSRSAAPAAHVYSDHENDSNDSGSDTDDTSALDTLRHSVTHSPEPRPARQHHTSSRTSGKRVDVLQIVDEHSDTETCSSNRPRSTRSTKRSSKASRKQHKHGHRTAAEPATTDVTLEPPSLPAAAADVYTPPLQLDSSDAGTAVYNEIYALIHACKTSRIICAQSAMLTRLIDDELHNTRHIRTYQADILKRMVTQCTYAEYRYRHQHGVYVHTQPSLLHTVKSLTTALNTLHGTDTTTVQLLPTLHTTTAETAALLHQCIEQRQLVSHMPATLQQQYDAELLQCVQQQMRVMQDKYTALCTEHQAAEQQQAADDTRMPLSVQLPNKHAVDEIMEEQKTQYADNNGGSSSVFVSPNAYIQPHSSTRGGARQSAVMSPDALTAWPNGSTAAMMSPTNIFGQQSRSSGSSTMNTPTAFRRVKSIAPNQTFHHESGAAHLSSPQTRVQRSYSTVDNGHQHHHGNEGGGLMTGFVRSVITSPITQG